MTTIKCPICKERLSGEEGEQLSAMLREHMASVHEMDELEGSHRAGAFHVPPSDYSKDSMTLKEAEGPVRESWREEMKIWTSPPVPARQSGEDRREAMLHQEGAERMTAPLPVKGAEAGRRMLRVECPLCDALITAPLEEDLSDDLRDHMADRHDIRPKRLAWIYERESR